MFENFPYSNYHNLNLDWLLSEMQKVGKEIEELREQIREVVNEEVAEVIKPIMIRLDNIEREYRELSARITKVDNRITEEVIELEQKLALLREEMQDMIIISNIRTDNAIAQNNEFIFKQIDENIVGNIRVINFFTGDRMTLQEMFDYLSNLHVDDGLTYSGLVQKNKTINQIINLGVNYTDLILHGGSLL